MSLHPVQLGLRLTLEMAGLAIFAYWGWAQGTGVLRWVYALGLMLLVAVVWGARRSRMIPPAPAGPTCAYQGSHGS